MIQRSDTWIVEVGCHCPKHRQRFGIGAKNLAISLHLLADITQCILGALAVIFIDRNQVRIIQHVDLFQLAGCTKFRRHHVQ